MAENPVLVEWTGRFGLPPFAAITDADFETAFAATLTEARAISRADAGGGAVVERAGVGPAGVDLLPSSGVPRVRQARSCAN